MMPHYYLSILLIPLHGLNPTTMKQIFKYIAAFILSALGGFALAVAGVLVFTDLTLEEYMGKFLSTDIMEMAGVVLFSIASFFVSIFIQIILHEGGHLVCGLATGYKFISFRIFNFTLIRKDGRFYIKRFKIAGTGGQCLLTPPSKPIEEIRTALYNAGGFIANIIASTIAFLLIAGCSSALLKVFLLLFGLTGVFMALINGIPMKVNGIGNDGDNMLSLGKNPAAKEAMIMQLRANALIVEGYTPIEMPREWFVAKDDPNAENISFAQDFNYSDAISLTVELMKISYLMDLRDDTLGRMEQAHKLLETAYSHKGEMMGLLVNETASELLFTSLVTGRIDLARSLYTAELEKYIATYRKVMSSKERTLWAVAFYMNNDKEAANAIYHNLLDHKDDFLMQGEVKMDIGLIERLQDLTINQKL